MMTFDACYIIHAGERPTFETVLSFWRLFGYRVENPLTGKIHTWSSEGDEVIVDRVPENSMLENGSVQLWSINETDVLISFNKRGEFFSEEYNFMGLSGELYISLIEQLNSRCLDLTKRGLLIGMLFDRRDYVLEALCDWK